jgi:hypothetical protein
VDDDLEVEFREVVSHQCDLDLWPTSMDDLRGVYLTIRRLSDGAILGRPWLPKVAIEQRRKVALTQDIWNKWPVEQAQKTAIKWAHSRGFLPADSTELRMALESDLELDIGRRDAPAVRQIADKGGIPDRDFAAESARLNQRVRVEHTPGSDEPEWESLASAPSGPDDSTGAPPVSAPTPAAVASPTPVPAVAPASSGASGPPDGGGSAAARNTERADLAAECQALEAQCKAIPALMGLGGEIRDSFSVPKTGAVSGKWARETLVRYRDGLRGEISRAMASPAGAQSSAVRAAEPATDAALPVCGMQAGAASVREPGDDGDEGGEEVET